jgi:hypothetical protein
MATKNKKQVTSARQKKLLQETKQFWKLRSSHGRDKLFKTPELLWLAACEYFQWCDDNPLKESTLFHHAGSIKAVNKDKMRPYTMVGLCLYLNTSQGYFRTFKARLNDKEEAKKNTEEDNNFVAIIHAIEETIYNQKFEGAAADMFNANIIARDLGLIDKKDITENQTIKYINASKQFPNQEP